jgi:hypothetical protein
VLATAATASSVAEDPITFRMRFAPGEVLRQRCTQVQSMSGGQMGSSESTTVFVMRQEVEEVAPDGTATLSVDYEAIKMDVEGPFPMSYDSTREGESAKENTPTLAAMFDPMLEAKLTMKMHPDGRVSDIDGFDELLEGLEGPVAATFKEVFSEDTLGRMIEVNVFPDKALEPGATWKRDYDQKLMNLGTLKLAFENTFSGVETRAGARCARILVAGTMSFEKGDQLPELEIEDGKISGEMWFAIDQGRTTETTIAVSDFVMRISSPELPESIEMALDTEVRTRFLGKDEPPFEDD